MELRAHRARTALTLAALYALLAEGAAVATVRNAFPAAERAHLALLTAPVAGYLAAGAVQLRALTGATTVPAAHAALATAAGHWTLTAAAVAGAVALVLACIGGRRTGG